MNFKNRVRKATLKIIFAFLSVFILVQHSYGENFPLTEKGNQAAFGNLKVVSQFGNVVFSDQPDKETVGMLNDNGIKLVLSIRGFNEKAGFNERKAVEEQGISFIQIPYMQGRDINGDALSEIISIIEATGENGTKIMLHCTRSQRAGSVLGAALYRDYGYTMEDANELAKQAGLTSKTLIKIHNKYLKSIKK